MRTIILCFLIFAVVSVVDASEIIPPDMLLPMIINAFQSKDTPVDKWAWAVDYARIEKSNPQLTKENVVALLKSINSSKVKFNDHDSLAWSLEMVEPKHLRFDFEVRETKNTKGPPTIYVLVEIDILEPSITNAKTTNQNTSAGKYILEIPYSGKDPRYDGKTYRFELTLEQNETYELNTESPIVKYVQNTKTGITGEALSVYRSNTGGNYKIEGNAVILSKPDPMLGKDIKFINGDLYYKDTKFQKIITNNNASVLARLDIKIGMERSKVENMIASALNAKNKYSPYGNNLKGGIVKYADGHFILEIKYKAGAPAPLFINKQGNTQGLPPIDETVESIKSYEE